MQHTMQIPQTLPQFNEQTALIVVSAKEEGALFRAQNGEVTEVADIEEHRPTRSDNEGFFFRSGAGETYGSGAPRERDDEYNLTKYVNAITSELNEVIKAEAPDVIYVFEPEHYKGYLQEKIENPTHIPIEHVAYGNYTNHQPLALIEAIAAHDDTEVNPSDPASVEGEEHAEEKRKILETGRE